MSVEETTLDILEESMDVMEETLDVVEAGLEKAVRSPIGGYILVGAVFGGVGAAAAYYITKRRTQAKYEAIAKQEIEEAKAFYSKMNKNDNFETPEKAAKTLKVIEGVDLSPAATKALSEYQGSETEDEPEDIPEEEGTVNVYMQHESPDENFDIDEEMQNRSPDQPYVINEQEFMENENGFSQNSISYYAGDGTLADERDQEIPFVEPIVGEENLQRFGHGSNDPRIVYIRNERLSTDFEVVLSDGKYAHEVLGLQHSDGGHRGRLQAKQTRKVRGGDE